MRLTDPHEFTGEISNLVDPLVADFLESMEKEGHLDNTIVELFGDHGDHVNYITEYTESGYTEKSNPMLIVTVPEAQKERIGDFVEKNT